MKANEFHPGSDHVSQVLKVEQMTVGLKMVGNLLEQMPNNCEFAIVQFKFTVLLKIFDCKLCFF